MPSVTMSGQVAGLAAPTATGPLFVSTPHGRDLSTTLLTALDLDGSVIWRRPFAGHPTPPRISDDGTVWLAHSSPRGHTLTELDADGALLRSITLDQAPHEHLGAFALLPDGACASWLPARHGQNGTRPVVDTCRARLPGGSADDHRAAPGAAADLGDREAATFADGGSGIAITYFLDTATGRLIATTEPGPIAHKPSRDQASS